MMALMISTWMKYTYFLICLISTIGLSIYSIYRYVLNEDNTVVKVSKYLSSKDAIYPSLSFCIKPPFLKNKFDVYGDTGINMTSYKNFLEGKLWDERMLRVEYDNVTVSLSDNFIRAGYTMHSKKFLGEYDWNPDHYVSFRASNQKCFTIDAPFHGHSMELVRQHNIKIKNDIFPDGKRSPASKIQTYLHYPGQRITAYYTMKNDFDNKITQNKRKNYIMKFRVRHVGVITRRNKKHEVCVEDWKYYEQKFMENRMNEIGCRPPHWKAIGNLATCTNAVQMKSFSDQPSTDEVESFYPPCKVINQVDYTYHEHNIKDKG